MTNKIVGYINDSIIGRLLDSTELTPYARRVYRKLVSIATPDYREINVCGEKVILHQETFVEVRTLNAFEDELPVVEDLCHNLRSSDVVWDIGSSIGAFACSLKSAQPESSVVAFEPIPASASRLRKNANLNDVEINVFEVAISDSNGAIEMELKGESEIGSQNALAPRGVGDISVDAATADTLIDEGLNPPDIVKIDVEGSEGLVIDGAEHMLSQARLIYCELHPDRMIGDWTAEDLKKRLEKRGFLVEEVHQRGGEQFIRASR